MVYTPQLARVVRANVVSQWDEDYVRAERVIGGSRTYILLKHVVRNTAAPVLVFATVMVADAIVFEASLSFLGAGVQPPHPSWGNILSEGRNIVLNGAWWATTFAGVMILLTCLLYTSPTQCFHESWYLPVSPVRKISFPYLPMKKSGKVRSEIP